MSNKKIILTVGAFLLVVCGVAYYFFFLSCVHDGKGVAHDIAGKTIDSDTLDKFYSDIEKRIKKELESGRISEKRAAMELRQFDPKRKRRSSGEIAREQIELAVESGKMSKEAGEKALRFQQWGESLTDKAQQPYVFKGSLVSQEETLQELQSLAEITGVSLPVYPYHPRMEEIFSIIKKQGYTLEELFQYYEPVLEEFATLSDENLLGAKKTSECLNLFEDDQKESINKLIKDRLTNAPNDIPALLMRLSLHRSMVMVEESFDDAESIAYALDTYEPIGLDKRAILYHVLNSVSTYSTMTQESINTAKENAKGNLKLGCIEILYLLEIGGGW